MKLRNKRTGEEIDLGRGPWEIVGDEGYPEDVGTPDPLRPYPNPNPLPKRWPEDYPTPPTFPTYPTYPIINYGDDTCNCLHKSCPECQGTGIKINGGGMCVHHISCPCPRCTPRC